MWKPCSSALRQTCSSVAGLHQDWPCSAILPLHASPSSGRSLTGFSQEHLLRDHLQQRPHLRVCFWENLTQLESLPCLDNMAKQNIRADGLGLWAAGLQTLVTIHLPQDCSELNLTFHFTETEAQRS